MRQKILQGSLMEAVQEIREKNKRYAWILLKAGTGQGKTTAIIEGLLPYAMKRQEKILYIVNRKALKIEINNRIEYAAICLENLRLTNYIQVVSYQDIEQMFLGVGRTVVERGKFAYVVADEIHYLDSDSQFNTNTQLSLEWLMKFDAGIVRIFMSATPEAIEGVICNEMKKRDENIRLGFPECNYNRTGTPMEAQMLYLYGKNQQNCPVLYKIGKYEKMAERFVEVRNVNLQTNYVYINPHVLADDKSVISAILKIKKTEKILIFVPSITEGKKIYNKLLEQRMEAEFVDSSYRWNNETENVYTYISEFHRSKARILISTAVIDTGIDIVDLDCNNVFVFAIEREAFMQMLGRRRMKEGERINLYIMNRSAKYLKNKCAGQQEILDTYNLCGRRNLNEILYVLFQQNYIKHEVFQKLYFFDKYYNCFRINELALQKTYRLVYWYQTLIENIENSQDEFVFAKEQLSWIGITFEETMLFCYDVELEKAEKELVKILEGRIDKELTIEDIRSIIAEIVPYCWMIKSNKEKIAVDIRNKGKTSWKKINDFLLEGGYPYAIQEIGQKKIDGSRKKTYLIKKLGQ